MDQYSIKQEKIKAMKNYKRAHNFLYNLVLYTLSSLITCLFFTYQFWFPSMKPILFSLPNIDLSILFNAKCLFILGNIIVFILIGESKLTRSSRSSPATEIYDEYVARSRRSSNDKVKVKKVVLKLKEEENKIVPSSRVEEKKMIVRREVYTLCGEEKKKEMRVSKSMHRLHEEKPRALRACKSEVWGESAIVKRNRTKGKEVEEQPYVPLTDPEELNERVEAFIAKVNKQRLLEAKLVDSGRD